MGKMGYVLVSVMDAITYNKKSVKFRKKLLEMCQG